jgi:hypothetical protein
MERNCRRDACRHRSSEGQRSDVSGSQARTLRREVVSYLRIDLGKSRRAAANQKVGNKIDELAGA